MAHPGGLTAAAIKGCCAKMARQHGWTMSFSLWPVACKGILTGRGVVTTCSSTFSRILGHKVGLFHPDGTHRQPTDSAMEAKKLLV
jgi:hypothetical protein